jgi:DNA adenine methylase
MALLNDINPHLTNFYLWLRRGFCIGTPMRHSERAHYAARARFNQIRAARQEKTSEAAALE